MSEPTLVIGNKNYSSWSLRPWLLLAHAGVPFREHRIPLDTPGWCEAIAGLSPTLRVPVLLDGDLTVWDSLAICEYAHETFPGVAGWPDGARARATARSIAAEMHSGFEALRERLPMNCRRRWRGFRVPEDARADVARVCTIWRQCRETHGGSGPWLFGAFSIADAMFAPVASRFVTYGVALGETESAYVATVMGSPAMVRWLAAAEAETEVIASAEAAGADPA